MNSKPSERPRVAEAFGTVLKKARKERGLSQEALCDGADLDRTYPSLLERGLRTPTLTVFIEIARALGMEPTQLLSETTALLRGQENDGP